MKTIFLAEAGRLDSERNQVNLDGLGFPDKPVPLLKDFDARLPIGTCRIFRDEEGLKAEASLPCEVLDGYPAIGFRVEASEPNAAGGRTFTKASLQSVSICSLPNADAGILRLSEQIKDAPRLLDTYKDA